MEQFPTLPHICRKPETTASSWHSLLTAHCQALCSLMNKDINCFFTEFSANVEKRPGFFLCCKYTKQLDKMESIRILWSLAVSSYFWGICSLSENFMQEDFPRERNWELGGLFSCSGIKTLSFIGEWSEKPNIYNSQFSGSPTRE